MNPQRFGGLATTVAGAAFIAWLTLLPNTGAIAAGDSGCCNTSDILLNTLLFVHLGIGLALLGLGPLAAGAIGGTLSIAIEVAQLFWVQGRDAAAHDVFSNALGTALGALVLARWAGRVEWWRWMSVLVGAGIVGAWFAAAFMVRPSYASPRRWESQWAREFEGSVRYPGQIVGLTLQGVPIPDGRIVGALELRRRIVATDTLRLVATILTAGSFQGRAHWPAW
jgi:hypothetical protein